MKKQKLLALSCCGESIEKVLTLYYHAAVISSPEFYAQYKPILFYGHNLPKKDHDSCAHGTIGFYQRFLQDIDFLPCTDARFLWEHRRQVLSKLVNNGFLSGRVAMRLEKEPERYHAFIVNLPFEVVYPQFMKELADRATKELGIFKLQPLYLEKNVTKMVVMINENRGRYIIYSLEPNGQIGTFYLDYKDIKELVHWCSELERKSILSGNIALLMYQIGMRIGPQTIVGYRKRENSRRPNREFALELLIQNRKTVIEPKNKAFNEYYIDLDKSLTDEQRGNIAFARGYSRFLHNYVEKWRLDSSIDGYIMRE